MLHATCYMLHITLKTIKVICEYSKISVLYIQKNGPIYKIQNIKTLIYNLLFKLKSKDQSFKINYCVNYLQLNRLVFQNKTCF